MSDMYDKDAAAHTYDQAGAACAVQSRGMNSDKKNPGRVMF